MIDPDTGKRSSETKLAIFVKWNAFSRSRRTFFTSLSGSIESGQKHEHRIDGHTLWAFNGRCHLCGRHEQASDSRVIAFGGLVRQKYLCTSGAASAQRTGG